MRRLLLVDDDPDIVEFISTVAEQQGYEVCSICRPSDFFESFKTFKPSALMLDLAIPDIDGIEIMRWLADEGCRTPIVIISGFGRPVLESAGHLGEARGLKIAATLSKPVRLAALRDVLAGLGQEA
jgi:DNA-binding response OmpR family regulator